MKICTPLGYIGPLKAAVCGSGRGLDFRADEGEGNSSLLRIVTVANVKQTPLLVSISRICTMYEYSSPKVGWCPKELVRMGI